jgi:hypothetical protein
MMSSGSFSIGFGGVSDDDVEVSAELLKPLELCAAGLDVT